MKKYEKEQIDELVGWFKNQTNLPSELKLDNATYIPNLQNTLEALYMQAYVAEGNSRMFGSIHLLERIKEKLLNMHK